jgi:hypothetical protein
MPRNFFNILRDNPESWGGKQNPLTLPTTRSSDKAQKSPATVKICAARFLCYKSSPDSLRSEKKQRSSRSFVTRLRSLTVILLVIHHATGAIFYVKTHQTAG